MEHYDLHEGWVCWIWIELVVLLVGLLGTLTACLANYGWHWNKESLFLMIFSAVPYGFLFLGNHLTHRIVKSRIIRPITTFLAIALTSLSLMVYISAVIHPNHSSGMVFAILPLCLMVSIPVVLILIIAGFLIAESRRSEKIK